MATGVKDIQFKDLEVEEVEVTSAVLMGGAHHLGQYCDKDFKTFMGCRYGHKDPRKCLDEGKQATKCALDYFKKLKEHCNDVFTKHWTCLDYNNQEFGYCRATQKKFDACVLEKLGLECTQPVHLELYDWFGSFLMNGYILWKLISMTSLGLNCDGHGKNLTCDGF